MPVARTKVIINPVAGGGSIHKQWPQVCHILSEAGIVFDCEFTKSIGHAIEISRQAVEAGYSYIIAAGGDGTVNEVANGILSSVSPVDVTLGVAKVGTSCSFARSLSVAQGRNMRPTFTFEKSRTVIDIGSVEYSCAGQHQQRFFINEASAGIGATVVNIRSRLPNRLGRSMNYGLYNIAAYGTLAFHRNKTVKISIGDVTEEFRACYMVVANGQYFAGGMRIAPHAVLDDGLLDVVTIGDVNKYELLGLASKVYSGIHIEQPEVLARKARTASIQCEERLFLEADGEMLGECPASFRVVPAALTVAMLELNINVSRDNSHASVVR